MSDAVRILVAVAFAFGASACGLDAFATPPAERITVHIPLAFNDGRPVPKAELDGLIGELTVLGPVAEHRGHGTFVDSHDHVSVEPVDHVVVTTTSARAERVVVSLLHRMRRDLRQESTLAEVVPDPHTWRTEEPRVQFDVVLAAQGGACDRTCASVRRLLDDAGGGDSEFDDANRAHLISSVPPKQATRVRAALHEQHLSFTERPAAFVLVTSPKSSS